MMRAWAILASLLSGCVVADRYSTVTIQIDPKIEAVANESARPVDKSPAPMLK